MTSGRCSMPRPLLYEHWATAAESADLEPTCITCPWRKGEHHGARWPLPALWHTLGGDMPRRKSLLFKNSFPPVCTGATHKGTVQQGHTEVSHPPCILWQHWSLVTHVHIQYRKQRSVNNDRIRDGGVYDYLLVPEQEEEALRSLCQMLSLREVHFLRCF